MNFCKMFWPVYDAQNLGALHICTTATQQAGFESGTFKLLGGLASGVAQFSVPCVGWPLSDGRVSQKLHSKIG